MTEQGLKRVLPGKFVLAVTVGGVIGLGILRGPGEIAEVVPDPFFYLALWLVGGLFVLLSTVVCAELVGMTPAVGSAVVVAAILMLLSHQNLAYMSAPRILYALAVDGFAAKRAQKVGKGGNPIFAVLVTWVTSVVLIMLGGFEFLLLLSVFFFVPLYLSLIVGVLILRKREPDSERPYRAWGHPYSTIVCLVGWTLITLFQAFAERETAIYALAMVAVSWPVYRYLISTQN